MASGTSPRTNVQQTKDQLQPAPRRNGDEIWRGEEGAFNSWCGIRPNPPPKLRRAGFLNSCELVVCAWNKAHQWNFGNQRDMHNFIESPICMGRERLKDPKHPTQKPVRILEHILKIGSTEGDLVFDPFMGVGSSGVAALNLRRRFLEFDKNPTYVNAAAQRFGDVCAMSVAPIRRGEPQPFLLTPTPFKSGEKLFVMTPTLVPRHTSPLIARCACPRRAKAPSSARPPESGEGNTC